MNTLHFSWNGPIPSIDALESDPDQLLLFPSTPPLVSDPVCLHIYGWLSYVDRQTAACVVGGEATVAVQADMG
jgi:hypothetical protein